MNSNRLLAQFLFKENNILTFSFDRFDWSIIIIIIAATNKIKPKINGQTHICPQFFVQNSRLRRVPKKNLFFFSIEYLHTNYKTKIEF